MLPCVCSVIDHRGRQNVVRTSVTHSAVPRVPLFCSYHILMSSVIYYWTDTRQHGIYLFYIIKKIKYTGENVFLFQISPLWQTRKEHWCDLMSIQNEGNWLVAMLSKELWSVQSQNLKNSKQTWIERCRHLCVCPLIGHRREPIRMRE